MRPGPLSYFLAAIKELNPAIVFNDSHNLTECFFYDQSVRGNHGYGHRCLLPEVLIVNLGHRYIESMSNPVNQAFQGEPFFLE